MDTSTEHYVCNGTCGSESKFKGTCQSEGCDKEGQPLTACHCEDGQHTIVKEQIAPTQEFSE